MSRRLGRCAAVVVCATFATAVAAAVETIGKEALIRLDTQALYSMAVNAGPGDGMDAAAPSSSESRSAYAS